MKSEFNVIRFAKKMVNEGLRKALRERDDRNRGTFYAIHGREEDIRLQ